MGRIKAIVVKEFFHILRDPRSLTMVFITPLVMIFILGYSVSYDLNRIDAALIDLSQSRLSRQLVRSFAANRVFVVHTRGSAPGLTLSLAEAEEMLRRREIKEIIVIPADLSRRLAAGGRAEIGLVIDGSDTNIANLVYQYDERIILEFNAGLLGAGGPAGRLLKLDTKIYFNPEARSQFFFIPGLVAVILLMIAAMLTSLSISRERETGSLSLLFISPLRSREIIVGKTIPYIAVALLDGVVILLFARFWFGIPTARQPAGAAAVRPALYRLRPGPGHPDLDHGADAADGHAGHAAFHHAAVISPFRLHFPPRLPKPGPARNLLCHPRNLLFTHHSRRGAQGGGVEAFSF